MQEQVGKRIRELRLALGMIQEAVAEKVKVNGKYFGAIERGEINVNLATLVRIAEALQVAPSDLLITDGGPAKGARGMDAYLEARCGQPESRCLRRGHPPEGVRMPANPHQDCGH